MKCPVCGQTLKPSKKDPNYLLCYNCKKKYRVPQKKREADAQSAGRSDGGTRYSNIPPEDVREKKSRQVKRGYEEMVNAGEEEEESLSRAPIVILGIAIVVVLALIVYMLVR